MYSTEGGMNIEEVAEETPHLIHKEEVDPKLELLHFNVEKLHLTLV